MMNTDTSNRQAGLFNTDSYWFKLFLVFIFILAALIRRDDIKAPGHLIEREFNSAIFARAFYFENNDNIELWRQENARVTREQFPVLEPPLTEFLISSLYQMIGQEEIWYGRYLTSAFWLIGGIFLFKIARKLISADAAVFAAAYYLLVPWGIIISRSVQPDSLMMMMFLISLYTIVKYFEKPVLRRVFLAGVLTGITLLLRPLVVFALFSAFIALSIHKKGNLKEVFSGHMAIFILLSIAFALAFYGYGILIAGSLRDQAALSFRPHLLFRLRFWRDWFELGTGVGGYAALAASFLGFFLMKKAAHRSLIIGLFAGYLIFGIVFTFHIITHPYYHIQLFPIIALSASPLIVRIGLILKESLAKKWWMPAAAIFLFAAYFSIQEARATLYTNVFEDRKLAVEIGDVIQHSPRTVFIAYHYGGPLQYYGEFAGAPWPVRIDDPFYRPPTEKELSVQERLDNLGFDPEYFVITNFDLYHKKHPDLKMYLEESCSLFAKQDAYLIYNSCQSFGKESTRHTPAQ